MTPRRRREEMRRVLQVRVAQRAAAEAGHGQAASRTRELEARRAEGEQRLAADEAAWTNLVGSSGGGWTVARALSVAVIGRADSLKTLASRIEQAEIERSSAATRCREALAREDVAATLARSAARAAARWREERVLGEAADRTARRSPRQ